MRESRIGLGLVLITYVFCVIFSGLETRNREAKASTPEPTPVIEYKILEVRSPPEIVVQPSIVAAKDLGEFEITYYTANKESTGKSKGHPAYGVTKSGAYVTEGITVAVDPSVIPLGSYLYIEGIGFRVAQDIGGAIKGNKVDVYVPGLKDIPEIGRHPAEVYLIGGGDQN